jgi:hypothetical protein
MDLQSLIFLVRHSRSPLTMLPAVILGVKYECLYILVPYMTAACSVGMTKDEVYCPYNLKERLL